MPVEEQHRGVSVAKIERTLQGSDEDVLSKLRNLRTKDKEAETTKKRGAYGAIAAVLAGLGIIVLFAKGSLSNSSVMPLLSLCAVALGFAFFVFFTGDAGDIDDDRYETLERLHRFLSQDCDKGAHYSYTIDFRSFTNSALRTNKTKTGHMFSYPIIVTETFETPVLSGQCKLRDGTSLSIAIDRTTTQRTRTKRNPRGKVKTKVKTKYRNSYLVKVKLPEEASLTGTQAKAAPLVREGNSVLKIDGPKVTVTNWEKTYESSIKAEPMLGLLAWTFRQINLSKQRAS